MRRKRRRSFLEKLRPSPGAVRIDVNSGWLSRGAIVIDRPSERAVFYNLSLWQPFWRTIRPLSMIVGVQVTKRRRGTRQPAYGFVIHLFKGNPIRFLCHSRTIAMATVEALQAQLPVETRSCGRYETQDAAQDDECDAPALWVRKTAHS